MEPIIVVHSRDGSSLIAAKLLREQIGGAEIRRLDEAESRRGVFGFVRAGFQATRRRPSTLRGNPWIGIEPGRPLYLVGPIWAGRPSPALRAFLIGPRGADSGGLLDGVQTHIVTVQADPDHQRADEVLTELSGLVAQAGGAVATTRMLTGASPGKTADRADLLRQLSSEESAHGS